MNNYVLLVFFLACENREFTATPLMLGNDPVDALRRVRNITRALEDRLIDKLVLYEFPSEACGVELIAQMSGTLNAESSGSADGDNSLIVYISKKKYGTDWEEEFRGEFGKFKIDSCNPNIEQVTVHVR